jgi:hypothetical protein
MQLAPLILMGLQIGCARSVTDLQLDSLSPPHTRTSWSGFPRTGAPSPVIVAELSTSSNLRDRATFPADSVFPYLAVCQGRTRISESDRDVAMVLRGPLQDNRGIVHDLVPSTEWPPPIDGRYRYRVAFHLRQQGREDRREGQPAFSLAELDLIRNPVDLCLYVDSTHFGPRWRTNTVVIPAEAIRAAITAATPR